MSPEMIERLNTLAGELFIVSCQFKECAQKNTPGVAGRLERLNISKEYCHTINGIHQFLIDDEATFMFEDDYNDLMSLENLEFEPEYDDTEENDI